jgi:SAM-dependent methyltransferase
MPGLVAAAFLEAGHSGVGVDLSAEMIARARKRCDFYGDRARFRKGSIYESAPEGLFGAAVSRYVLHHRGHSSPDRWSNLGPVGSWCLAITRQTPTPSGRLAQSN